MGNLPEEVLSVLRDVRRDVEFAFQNVLFDNLLAAVRGEGGAAGDQVEEEDAQRPPVGRLPVSRILDYDLMQI